MLIPRRVLACLCCQLQGVFGFLVCPAQQHTAAGGGDDLVAVKGQPAKLAKSAAFLSVVCRPQSLGGVLNQRDMMLTADGSDLIQFGGIAVQVYRDHRLRRTVQLKRTAQRGRIHVPCLALRVDEHRLCAAIDNRIDRRGEGQALAEHRVTGLHACEDHCQMQRRRTGRQGNGIAPSHVSAYRFFKFVDILPQRCDPVFPKRIVDVLQFIALVRHMRAGQ